MVEAAEWERGAAEVRERKAQPESPNGKNAAEAIKREERGRSRQEIKNAAETAEKEKRGRNRVSASCGRTGRISVEIEEIAFGKTMQQSRPNIAKSTDDIDSGNGNSVLNVMQE
ncbi:hypothetical protein [Paraburkholderia kururiensis]|uniref:hypothetical protein n=1 Tax=Paraburkholderia kururiensis TaxID=984307 RepID=UPI0018F326BA|nr:hypothetical protein [Paraburkholderia kururiensis]